jgi:hypothetical protein
MLQTAETAVLDRDEGLVAGSGLGVVGQKIRGLSLVLF